ncbi:MAG: SusE domain-containing protein [Bacteroidales bacterium]|nr:SusE domain-containing protein [Bacteroidales bacterium]
MFRKALLSVFAMAALLMSCTPEDITPVQDGPVRAEKLISPREGLSVNMYLLEVLQFEWSAARDGATYSLVFDKADGDFSSPVASFQTDETSLMLDKATVQEIFEQNADEKGEVAELSWGVFAVYDDAATISAQTRHITFTTLSVPAEVETLVAPADGVELNLETMEGDLAFSWSKAIWLGNDDGLSYTLVVDEDGKDFSEPLYSVEVKGTEAVMPKSALAEIYAASSVAAEEESYMLKWAVYANVGPVSTISAESRTFSVIPKTKVEPVRPFEPGDKLYIWIPGSSESGQVMTYLTDTYYRTGNDSYHDRLDAWKWAFPYYEIFTSLSAGQKYCFCTLDADSERTHLFKVTSDGFAEVEDETAAFAEVSVDGIYRIRINASDSRMVDIRRVEYINLRFAWGDYNSNSYNDAAMTYSGKGLWTAPGYHVEIKDRGGWFEDRYRFVMKMEGIASPYGLSKNNEGLVTDNRPGQGEDASYWHLQTSYTGWDHWVFKYPAWLCDESNPGRWCADVKLYMNADKGHYTHEFVNPAEMKAFADGDPLYIAGQGTEAGQKMSYITSSSYNTSIGQSGEVDAFRDQDYRYEIFTKLQAGARFYFRSETNSDYYSLNESGTEVVKIASPSDAAGTVQEEGIYRIRFNVQSGQAYVAKVDEVSHFFCFTEQLTPMKYLGKGVWVIENLNIKLAQAGWGVEERYKFKFVIDGQAQPYGRMSTYGDRPNASTSADYWYVQPTRPNQWDPSFKYPDSLYDTTNFTRWYADLYLYMNDDRGHYTHEFTNAHE